MGWSTGFDSQWNRDIGYGVPATCDYPGCGEEIDRGLAHVCCNQEPYGGEHGCGLYFCGKHHLDARDAFDFREMHAKYKTRATDSASLTQEPKA